MTNDSTVLKTRVQGHHYQVPESLWCYIFENVFADAANKNKLNSSWSLAWQRFHFLAFPGERDTWVLQITLSSSPLTLVNMGSFRIVSSIKRASLRLGIWNSMEAVQVEWLLVVKQIVACYQGMWLHCQKKSVEWKPFSEECSSHTIMESLIARGVVKITLGLSQSDTLYIYWGTSWLCPDKQSWCFPIESAAGKL